MKNTIILIIVFLSCSSKATKDGLCRYEQTNFKLVLNITTPMENVEDHYVFLDSLSNNCLDSALLILTLFRYLQTAEHQYQIRNISFVTDTSAFDFGETISQHWTEINKHCILDVWLDDEKKLREYTFYGADGKYCYRGPLWQPCK